MKRLVRDRILEKHERTVRFPKSAWVKQLRALLRAYREKLEPDLEKTVLESARYSKHARSRGTEVELFGCNATQRALIVMATEGPLESGVLLQKAAMHGFAKPLRRLVTAGILVRRKVPRKYKNIGPSYLAGLNAAHPIFPELQALLCALGGAEPSDKPQLREERNFTIDGLFFTRQRLFSLIAIGLAKHRYIYPASMRRLFPRLHYWSITVMLRQWAADPKGLVRRTNTKLLPAFYEINPAYPHYPELRALLTRIGEVWPEYRINAETEEAISPARWDRYGTRKHRRRSVRKRSLSR